MRTKTKWMLGVTSAAALVVTGCVTDPYTGKQTVSTKGAIGTLIGGVAGYFLGDLVGGKNSRTEKILGAGIGAVAGGAVGTYMDRQQRELEEKTAGTGVDITRDGNQLILNMPGDVTFAYDSDAVQPQFYDTLNKVAKTLVDYPSTYIDVYGHTDTRGSDSYNMGLSERRAGSVARYLNGQGVQLARIGTRGYGETQPKCSGMTEADHQCNRRVEIRVVPMTDADVSATK